MKFAIAVAAFAGAAVAQDACLPLAASIPACALGYLVSAASEVASCGLVDFQCQCSNSMAIQNAVINTVLAACSASAQSVIGSVQNLCECATSNAGQQVSLDAVQSACLPSAAAIPPCALGYLADAGNSIGNCAVDDFACQCSISGSIQQAIASTLGVQCTEGGGLGDVIASAGALCSCVSANNGGSGSSPSASPTDTGSGTSPTGGSSPSPSATGTGAAPTATASPSFTKFTGAAVSAIPAVGGIFGAVIGLLAYL